MKRFIWILAAVTLILSAVLVSYGGRPGQGYSGGYYYIPSYSNGIADWVTNTLDKNNKADTITWELPNYTYAIGMEFMTTTATADSDSAHFSYRFLQDYSEQNLAAGSKWFDLGWRNSSGVATQYLTPTRNRLYFAYDSTGNMSLHADPGHYLEGIVAFGLDSTQSVVYKIRPKIVRVSQ
jgi:hypothetical protein